MAEFAIKWTQGGKEAFNVVTFLDAPNGIPGQGTDPGYAEAYPGAPMARKIGMSLMDALEDRLSVDVVLDSVTELGNNPQTSTIARAGLNPQSALPINCAYLINKNPSIGRRGRMFMPGVTESGTSSGGVHSLTVSVLFNDSLNDWMWRMQAENIGMAITRKAGNNSLVHSLDLKNEIGQQSERMRN